MNNNNSNTSQDQTIPSSVTVDHEQKINELIKVVIQLKNELNDLKTNNQHNTVEYDVKPPEEFTGKRYKLANFLSQCKIVFKSQPNKYKSGSAQVLYAISYLRGSAFSWVQPYIDSKENADFLNDFEHFSDEIQKAFGDPNLALTAGIQLDDLAQTYSVARYVSEFKRISALVSWNDDALCHRFYRGLSDSIKDQMVHHSKPKNLNELIEIALNADARLYERTKDKYKTFKTSNHITEDNKAMEIDATVIRRNPTTVENRQKKINNKFFYHCTKPNHQSDTLSANIDINKSENY
jgi:Domain of unknown function (DUF4939)